MRRVVSSTSMARVLAVSVSIFAAWPAASAPTEYLKEEPAKGAVRRGDVVYVDDGTCPAGEVKKMIGGNQKAGAPRQVLCAKRPD